MSHQQQFQEMLTGLGRAREIGLAPGHAILLRRCPTCRANTDHVATEAVSGAGKAYTVLSCVVCLTVREETLR